MSGRILGIVPARLSSTRLPQKPLYPLLGQPLIAWVWHRVRQVPALDACVIATDSTQIADVCRSFGAAVELTSSSHPSGTDRVAEVAARGDYRSFEILVNIQGDEPLIDADHVRAAVDLVESGWDVGTCATPVRSKSEFEDPSSVKVVRGERGRAMYFSRSPVPHSRDAAPRFSGGAESPWLRHVGLYAYRREALERWVSLPPTELEGLEGLEQLRPLEAGISIGVAVVDAAEPGVDTPADAAQMEARLRELGESLYV